MSVLYDYICSDHKPLSLSLCLGNSDSTVIGENFSYNIRKSQDLSKIPSQIWGKYKSLTDQYLQNLHLPSDGILCKEMNCSNSSHIDAISDFYEEMISCLLLSCEVLSNDNDPSHFKCSSLPGWNSTVKEAHRVQVMLSVLCADQAPSSNIVSDRAEDMNNKKNLMLLQKNLYLLGHQKPFGGTYRKPLIVDLTCPHLLMTVQERLILLKYGGNITGTYLIV